MVKVMKLAETVFKYGFGGIILALLIVYLWGAFFAREIGFDKYEKQFLAATLFWLVGLAISHAASLSAARQTLRSTEQCLAVLAKAAADARNAVDVRFYEGDEVYEATRRAIIKARRRVWVTYLRGEGPNRREAAQKHFEACRDWAMQTEAHSFRRIILHSDKPAMGDFYRSELRSAIEADTRKRCYQVKLLEGSVHSTEAFSVGIIDDLVFFTHRDGPDHTVGIRIRSEKLANEYIKEYYNRLWHLDTARPIQEVFSAATPAPRTP